jgi:adenylate cyclase
MDVQTDNREPTAAAAGTDQNPEEASHWRALLTGEDPALRSLRRTWARIPNGPRCKVCAAPFHGPGRILTRLIMHGQSVVNPTMCQMCFRQLSGHPGGAEVDISILFADIRGSTGIAETIGAEAFRTSLQAFYGFATKAIEARGGYVDKYLGDGVMALFIPVLAGEAHAERALGAAIDLVAAVEQSPLPGTGVRVGAGVHHGPAFVGVLGSGEKLDFSALGDAVNVAARLGAIAGPGEVLASRDVWVAAGRGAEGGLARRVELTGRREPLDVVCVIPAGAIAVAAG